MSISRSVGLILFLSLFFVACQQAEVSEEGPATATATAEPTATPPPTIAPTETPDPALAIEMSLDTFVEQLQTAVGNQDYAAMQMMMDDPLAVGGWRSEWRMYTPAQAITEFQNDALPAPQAVQFTGLTDADLTALLGQTPASMFGPDATVVTALHSSGWGAGGEDEAILFVTQEDGRFVWSAFLYTDGPFAQSDSSETAVDESGNFPVVETAVTYVIARQDVIMYSGPGEQNDEIGGVFDGQTALVTGQSEDGSWWRVICPDDTIGDCWISADPAYTQPTQPANSGTDNVFPVVETDVNYVRAQQNVTIYSGPGDTYDVIGDIFDGQVALVTGQSEDGNWWRVICPDDTIGDCWVTADPAFTAPVTGG